ncbi:hypothetical protein BV22DRAFT_1052118 [Leucogyrophana mollusca]|uniref:Uncharacterized protein n=1 Tax=Leucogyrophana mollusca TaxID=85980 RepID=A0ACB8AXA6_9AGAM|nr:hypothetical protein BV22DRAFT_1052118 [Leucogyrophana mollusca]
MPQAPASTRTPSSRQQRPAEKENYRSNAVRRKAEKEKKVQKKAQKAARRAPQQEEDSDDSNVNAEVYSSDADQINDTMFEDRDVQTKHSAKKVLSFRSTNIPAADTVFTPAASVTGVRHDIARFPSPSDNDDSDTPTSDNDIEDNNDDAVTLNGGKRGRREFDGNGDSKAQKGNDGSKRRTKASDFDEFTQDVLSVAIAIFRCLVCTTAPFPETTAIETRLAEQAWTEACGRTNLNVRLTPAILKMITKRTSHVRGELKTKARPLTATFSAFAREGSRVSLPVIGSVRTTSKKDTELRIGPYKTEIIQLVINDMWFTNRHDEGILYHDHFDPIPVEAIALVLTAIECCIDEWATGIKEEIQFSAAAYGDVYRAHLSSLMKFGEHTKKYNLLGKLSQRLHDNARFHSGAEPIKTRLALSHSAFEAAMREYEEESATEDDEPEGNGEVEDNEQDGGSDVGVLDSEV